MKSAWPYLVSLLILVAAGGFIAHLRSSSIPDEAVGFASALPKLGQSPQRTIDYEASGPAGTPVRVSYLDEHAQAHDADAVLPWQESLRTASPTVMTGLIVQSKAGGVGCRIIIDGTVRDEQPPSASANVANCKVQVA
ncbi:membrane family protein [Segniliparus rotundus DSM 44985]|uniref:Membrane family protein n=1 Tax=Segniliparus rotundus (strain ATCC BAA-972 / CDC 1076 / CIP 108378 / DSM 44985 / JCM 13578) TaxID=640132 RepID=D6ZB44_SEGRD|nr:MmpS family transport accessory protein [Segniliparus rotundus]ADG96803.1 membrane family protein [Segniliparus rotundus DSM 44985]